VVSADPVNYTPNVEKGAVQSVAKVGNTLVAVGKFTQVTWGGTTYPRTNIFAFNANTGEVSTTFVPTVNGAVNRVVSAGDGTSVFIGGKFDQVNGQNASHVARLDVSDGALVDGFRAEPSNGIVFDMVLNRGRLFVGGKFLKVGGESRPLLAALDPNTGKDTDTVTATFSDVFNGGTLSVRALDVSTDGSRLVAVGNFRTVDGQSRPQIAMFDTAATPATLDPWSTQRFTRKCSGAFDSYMRDVSISPKGDYFVVATTGAYDGGLRTGTLCDTITRWELGASAPDQHPTWVNYSGGDTFYAVSAVGRIVYIGGHQRWVNNPYAADKPGPGAVSREGIAAFDARNGMPLSWNPGRARGVGLREFLPVDDGLWIAHDTNRLGREQRKRIAFMPLAGGKALPSENTGTLPGDVYLVGQVPPPSPHWIARVNTGGTTVIATDAGPDWAVDTQTQPSPYRNPGSKASDWSRLTFSRHASVPGYAPTALFSTERRDPSGGNEMKWAFPAPAGHNLTVNLFFANSCSCTELAGQRNFDVTIEGVKVLDDYDIVAEVGDQTGVMKSYDVSTSDGIVNVNFGHGTVNNPLVNAIEIIDNTEPAPSGVNDTVVDRDFDGNVVTAQQTVGNGAEPWSQARGAFMVDGVVYYGQSDGTLRSRTYDGTTWGPEQTLPLNSASTVNHTFMSDLPNVTGMFYDKATARLYYTLADNPQMYYRYFLPESGFVGAVRMDGPSAPSEVSWGDVSGMFLAGGQLYFGDRNDAKLRKVAWNGGLPSGLATTLAPEDDWRARGMFLYAG